jgi:hypothetical protein
MFAFARSRIESDSVDSFSCWGFDERLSKLLSRRVTLIGNYEKASQHRLCKNEQAEKYRTSAQKETFAAPILHSAT